MLLFGEPRTKKNRFYLGIAQKKSRNPCPHCLFFGEYKALLSHLIFVIFHQYLPWFQSRYHLRIIFDLCHCQNIHSQSQNGCFKNFLIFGKNIVPQSARICAIGGVKSQFGQCPNIHGFFLGVASLSVCFSHPQFIAARQLAGAVWIGLHQSRPQTQFTWTWAEYHGFKYFSNKTFPRS